MVASIPCFQCTEAWSSIALAMFEMVLMALSATPYWWWALLPQYCIFWLWLQICSTNLLALKASPSVRYVSGITPWLNAYFSKFCFALIVSTAENPSWNSTFTYPLAWSIKMHPPMYLSEVAFPYESKVHPFSLDSKWSTDMLAPALRSFIFNVPSLTAVGVCVFPLFGRQWPFANSQIKHFGIWHLEAAENFPAGKASDLKICYTNSI